MISIPKELEMSEPQRWIALQPTTQLFKTGHQVAVLCLKLNCLISCFFFLLAMWTIPLQLRRLWLMFVVFFFVLCMHGQFNLLTHRVTSIKFLYTILPLNHISAQSIFCFITHRNCVTVLTSAPFIPGSPGLPVLPAFPWDLIQNNNIFSY